MQRDKELKKTFKSMVERSKEAQKKFAEALAKETERAMKAEEAIRARIGNISESLSNVDEDNEDKEKN